MVTVSPSRLAVASSAWPSRCSLAVPSFIEALPSFQTDWMTVFGRMSDGTGRRNGVGLGVTETRYGLAGGSDGMPAASALPSASITDAGTASSRNCRLLMKPPYVSEACLNR